MVIDKNGIKIIKGQTVKVHQEEGIREAIVIEPFPDNPTENQSGYWVDINIENGGVEGMMSYILEVI